LKAEAYDGQDGFAIGPGATYFENVRSRLPARYAAALVVLRDHLLSQPAAEPTLLRVLVARGEEKSPLESGLAARNGGPTRQPAGRVDQPD
jgi:hypothetical protein